MADNLNRNDGHSRNRVSPSLNGDVRTLKVERALAELRRGRAIHIQGAKAGMLVTALETTTPEYVERLVNLKAGPVLLAITGQRAVALGLAGSPEQHWVLHPAQPVQFAELAAVAGLAPRPAMAAIDLDSLEVAPCNPEVAAGLQLAKHGRLMPALCTVAIDRSAISDDVIAITTADIDYFEKPRVDDLEWVSDARVPLSGHENCRLVLFRDVRDGTEHVAVLVGHIDKTEPVPVRVHSACLTGDLLGSLRCDCGDQLRNAVDQLGAAGGGILLYLAQEGRGIGLANKLRAYHLQDGGLDTLDADQALGFRSDERSFAVAALMLHKLGVNRIQLLTNNPSKFRQLQDAGIEVVARQSLTGAVNEHNARYIKAKLERAGHLPGDA
ncbi:MAG: GTP cyclohydrolase II [Steroidobacteraceae bacterium]